MPYSKRLPVHQGPKVELFDEKNQRWKTSCQGPFNMSDVWEAFLHGKGFSTNAPTFLEGLNMKATLS
jgi:hypothetical protein